MENLKRVMNFVELTHQFQNIERVMYAGVGNDRLENDAGHSYQVAMLAWYINTSQKLNFNNEKLFKYALPHDLVEAYAGDTSIHDEEARKDKHDREEKALQKIIELFPESDDIYETIKSYEKREDGESKFVYAIDKFLPMLNAYLDNGRSWHKNNVSYNTIQEYKLPKIEIDPTIKSLYSEFTDLLEEKKNILFPRP